MWTRSSREYVIMPQTLVGTGGFLAAVLWMDLMFDVQALGHPGTLPGDVLASIAAYYHRVTTTADPMGNVVSLVMLVTVLGAVLQLSRAALPLWLRAGTLVTALVPGVFALALIVPAAVRVGARTDPAPVQSELVRFILWGHLACLACVLLFVGLQILAVQRLRVAEPVPL
jgi:hypothetical protein